MRAVTAYISVIDVVLCYWLAVVSLQPIRVSEGERDSCLTPELALSTPYCARSALADGLTSGSDLLLCAHGSCCAQV